MRVGFKRVHQAIIVTIECFFCRQEIDFIKPYRNLSDMLDFTPVASCPHCGNSHEHLEEHGDPGIAPYPRTAERWVNIAQEKRFDVDDAVACFIEQANMPILKRNSEHSGKRRKKVIASFTIGFSEEYSA